MLKHPKDGKLIAEKVIEGIFPESYDRIIYTILEEVDKEFDAEKIILNSVGLKYNVEVVKLTKKQVDLQKRHIKLYFRQMLTEIFV